MFHPDLIIRYEQKIRKGMLRVSKREDISQQNYLRWQFTNVAHEIRPLWPILVIFTFLVIWTYAFQFILDNYADSCTLNLFNLIISVKISFWFGEILPLLFYVVATSIAAVSMIKYKLDTMGEWQLDLRRSNKLYIVERRRSTKFIKIQRIFIGVILGFILISCLYLIGFFGKAGYGILSEYNYSIIDINKILIDECQRDNFIN